MGLFGKEDHGKPLGLPEGWPNSSPEQIEALKNRFISLGGEQRYHFSDNFVKTSKYEVYNFLGKFMFEEFNPKQKMANVYFLAVAALQLVPMISNTGGVPTTLLPLTFVVVVDAIFAIIEDIARHKADTLANSSVAHRFDAARGDFVDVQWYELQVGDFVKLYSRETIPCDMILLSTSEKNTNTPPEGVCYIETKSLDGETNLKMRHVSKLTLGKMNIPNDLGRIKGNVEMEHPNKLIDAFTGVMDIEGLGRTAISPNNVLLRGCSLRNTEWVVGVVANSGHDTKIMMSSTATPSKASDLESRSSEEIRTIVVMLLTLCLVGASGQAIWDDHWAEKAWYLRWDDLETGPQWVTQFFYFFLLHATFIPVSLYVSMSVMRFFQARQMNSDIDMRYDITNTYAKVRTMTLNEELGQISHVFSDKTGTLTCNIMDFRKFSVCTTNGVYRYGRGTTEIGKAALKLQGKQVGTDDAEADRLGRAEQCEHVNFYDPAYHEDATGKNGDERKSRIRMFFECLAVCHSVIPERIEGKIRLSASNPDDEALVCAAERFGFAFRDKVGDDIFVEQIPYKAFGLGPQANASPVSSSSSSSGGSGGAGASNQSSANPMLRYTVLEILEFNSDRKRMSVVLRMPGDGRVRIMTKGADAMMLNRLKKGQDNDVHHLNNHMTGYAEEGLRCLVLGYRDLSNEEFASWHHHYKNACSSLEEVQKRKDGKANRIDDLMSEVEQNLTLIGATAIEDKLQDGVPECIAQLARAGISIWVLTGDKEETAINISVACNLIKPSEYMHRVLVNRDTCPTPEHMTNLFRRECADLDREIQQLAASPTSPRTPRSMQGQVKERALVIDGSSLISCLDSAVQVDLLAFAKRCKAVVACRVSPDQKRLMVKLIKDNVQGSRTLAIGDGANDVAMIQAAHVGIGISGQEGMQAVNSADYAIAQFRFLENLTITHGRYNYRRMCKMVCYMFYKNILMSIAQFWFATRNGFSGIKIYTEGGIQLFNLAFTAFPILFIGVLDTDVSLRSLKLYPELYKPCIQGYFFRRTLFFRWLLAALTEAAVCSVIPLYALMNANDSVGSGGTLFEFGGLVLTCAVFVANVKILFIQHKWRMINVTIIVLSLLSWFVVAFISNAITALDYEFYGVFARIVSTPDFWLTLCLCVCICAGKDLLIKGAIKMITPAPHHVVLEHEVFTLAELERTRSKSSASSTNLNGVTPLNVASTSSTSSGDMELGMRKSSPAMSHATHDNGEVHNAVYSNAPSPSPRTVKMQQNMPGRL